MAINDPKDTVSSDKPFSVCGEQSANVKAANIIAFAITELAAAVREHSQVIREEAKADRELQMAMIEHSEVLLQDVTDSEEDDDDAGEEWKG